MKAWYLTNNWDLRTTQSATFDYVVQRSMRMLESQDCENFLESVYPSSKYQVLPVAVRHISRVCLAQLESLQSTNSPPPSEATSTKVSDKDEDEDEDKVEDKDKDNNNNNDKDKNKNKGKGKDKGKDKDKDKASAKDKDQVKTKDKASAKDKDKTLPLALSLALSLSLAFTLSLALVLSLVLSLSLALALALSLALPLAKGKASAKNKAKFSVKNKAKFSVKNKAKASVKNKNKSSAKDRNKSNAKDKASSKNKAKAKSKYYSPTRPSLQTLRSLWPRVRVVLIRVVDPLEVDTIWHYDVSITPEIPTAKARKLWKIIEKLPELAKTKIVFDGNCNAYAAKELELEKFSKKVKLPEESRAEFTVKMNRIAVINLEELHRFLRREGPITPGCITAIQALNITMTHKIFSDSVSFGRSAFSPQNAVNLGGGVEKWEGVFQSVRPGQGRLYANIDVASTAFYKAGNVADLMGEVVHRPVRELNNLQKYDYQTLNKHFKGCSFTVTHRGDSHKRRYKASGLSMMPAEKVFFNQETNGGKTVKVSIPEYYRTAYKLRLQLPFLPCLGVQGRDGTMYFPAEVCNVVPGTRYTRKLNEDQATAMTRSTCIRPDIRAEKIRALHTKLDMPRNEYMKGFGMEVARDMTVVPARVLPPPRIQYKGNVPVTPQFGGWQLNPSRKMVQGSTLASWGVLVYDRENRLDRPKINNFLRFLTSTLQENGMNVTQPNPPIMYSQIGAVDKNVEAMVSSIQQANQNRQLPQLIFVVMPFKSQTYSAIKTYCETTHRIGVMTQCALSKNIFKPNKQYCGNLGLKINTKLGGVNNTLDKNAIPFLTQKPTMIIGADVIHPAPGQSRPSVVAVVASMDSMSFKYSGRLKVQDSRVEVIEGLKSLVHQLLVSFKEKNRVYPQRILFYRDGVSEGQYAEIMQKEVAAVKEACEQAQIKALVTFCVVKKRHHARLFPMNANEADRSGNCVAGTVVDTVITHPTEFDFYLQSHGGLQGTSRPTLYHVILDEYGFKSDELQELTYRLCHVYARCTKSVSIVPSVYYAHLLAYRARHYQGEFSDTASMASSSTMDNFETANGIRDLMYFV
ncbi:Protein argonaute 10 [Modicella reniformis]|uniref:Protein argonaute 10 n=1 Tax=Modicella reniformis TaxID=1440133 RepID=A0A9P6MHD0_9FUNG|nr:Protein argonaute 10 [Modicella reniformis]